MGDNSIYLYWETASETVYEFIIVERSADTETWRGIKTIARTGTSASPSQYFYVDSRLQNGNYYYRLKLVNNTGEPSYSNIVSAAVSGDNTDISMPGTPGSSNQLYIGGITNIEQWEVSVLSAAASLVLKPAILNSNILDVPVEHSGVYLLKLQNRVDGRVKTIRFLKK